MKPRHWRDRYHELRDRPRSEENVGKGGKAWPLTGETLTITVDEYSIPEDRNLYSQYPKLLMDLAADAEELALLIDEITGWSPPKGEELDRLIELSERFHFQRSDNMLPTTWYVDAALRRKAKEEAA